MNFWSSGSALAQRGELRPCDLASVPNATGGDGADIGAFEVQDVSSSNALPNAVDDNAVTFEVDRRLHTIAVLAGDDPGMLGVPRTCVSKAAADLQAADLRICHGHITILDAAKLQAAHSECCTIVRATIRSL